MKIVEVIIEGFWDSHIVKYKLNPHVNILIGKNGSGKTHFLKILEAVLTGDLVSIMELDFRKATVKYAVDKKLKFISVEKGKIVETRSIKTSSKPKKVEVVTDDLVYTIDDRELVVSRGSRLRFPVENSNFNRVSELEIRNRLSDIFKLVILSVDRLSDSTDNRSRESTLFNTLIETEKREKAFESIIRSLGNRRVQIKDELAIVSRETEKKVLEALIFDTGDSKTDIDSARKYVHEGKKDTFVSFFSDLGFFDEKIKNKIDFLFQELGELPQLVSEVLDQDKVNLEGINRLTGLISSLSRTEKVMSVYNWSKKEQEGVNHDWNKYLEILSNFMNDKNFGFDNDGVFTAKSGNKSLKLSELSSGEKQIFYMLTKSYLESSGDHIFIADEPELSLHIEWQEKILSSMVELNDDGQYIVATHSPEIAGSFANNITSMEEIFSGNTN